MKDFIRKWILPPGVSSFITRAVNSGELNPMNQALSSEDKQLLAKNKVLRNRHRGERCFILGAGSSIKEHNLKKLKGETIISVSNTFVHPDFHVFRPRYHVVPHILHGHSQYSKEKFIEWLAEMERRTFDAEIIFHIGDKSLIDNNGLYQKRTLHWVEHQGWDWDFGTNIDLSRVPPIWSVSELAITVAVYMGYDKIYLIGIDHDWFNGLFKYFFDEKTEHLVKPDASIIPHVDAEFQMRRHAQIFKKYKYLYGIKKNIYNANADPDHYLDVFPKVDYDSLFEEKSQQD